MNVILVGPGYIAEKHVHALRELGHRVTWVVGRSAEHACAFAEKHGIPNSGTVLADALDTDAESVHICTPPTAHFAQAKESLAAGKHVISEKPLCLSVPETEELASLARQTGKISALCCNVRYYPAVREASRRIREGEIGRPLILSGSYLQEYHAPPHADGWRFNMSLSGDQRAISEIGTHWIDLAYAWTGLRITAVSAALGNWYPVRFRKDGILSAVPEGEAVAVDTEDAAAVTLRFDNGAIGALMLSELSRGHFNDLTLEVNGTDGTVCWNEANPETLAVLENGSLCSKQFRPYDRDETFRDLFREVYAAIEGRPHGPFPSFEDGVYLARVCSAIRRSGVTGEWIEI